MRGKLHPVTRAQAPILEDLSVRYAFAGRFTDALGAVAQAQFPRR